MRAAAVAVPRHYGTLAPSPTQGLDTCPLASVQLMSARPHDPLGWASPSAVATSIRKEESVKRLPRPVILACATILIPSARAQLNATPFWESANLGTAHLRGIAYDTDGSLYACSYGTGEVLVYQSTGGALSTLSGSITVTAPRAVAIRPGTVDPRVYVVSGTTSTTIRVFNPEADPPSVPATFPACGSPYATIEQLRFSPDGTMLYVTTSGVQNTFTKLVQSIVRVWKCTAGDTWTDTGLWLAPRNSDLAIADPDPRNNQGQSHGLAVDSNGNVWVASDADPVVWNGTTSSGTSYKATYGKYARPMRYYQRVVGSGGEVSFVPAAEIPLDNKIMGIAVNAEGVLFAAESINTGLTGAPSAKSHRIYAYRGTNRMGYIETDTGPETMIEDLQFLDIRPGDTGPTVQGKRGTGVYLQQISVTGLPTVPARVVQGRVTDADTGQVLAGATVRLYDQSLVTDINGHYQLSVPDSGVASALNEGAPVPPDPYYILSADADGYLRTLVEKVRVHADTTLDIGLHAVSAGVSASVGEVDTQRGLRVTNVHEGDTEVVAADLQTTTGRRTLAGSAAPNNLTGNDKVDSKLFFDVDEAFHNGDVEAMLVSVRWYDGVPDPEKGWRIEYDSSNSTNTNSLEVRGNQTRRLGTTAVYLPNAKFGNRQASGSDFNIFGASGKSLTVLDVAVTKQMPLFRSGVIPEGWESGALLPGVSVEGTPTVYNRIAYVGGSNSTLLAVDLDSASLLTGFGTNGIITLVSPVVGRPSVYLDANGEPHIVVATSTGAVYSVNGLTGAPDWPFVDINYALPPFYPLGQGNTVVSAPCVYMDTSVSPAVPLIWVGINAGDRATLVRLRGDDPRVGILELPLTDGTSEPSTISCAPAVGANGTRVMAGYTQGGNGHLLMVSNPQLDGTGGTAVTVHTDIAVPGESINIPATLTRNGTTLLLGSSNGRTGHVWAVNKDNGQPAWSAAVGPVDSPMWMDYTPPAETLYVMTRDNRLHALDLGNQGQPRAGWPVRPPVGMLGGPLFTVGQNLYAGSNLGLLVIDKGTPGTFTALSPISLESQSTAIPLPAMDIGASVTGHTPDDIIVTTGPDGKLYAIKIQP